MQFETKCLFHARKIFLVFQTMSCKHIYNDINLNEDFRIRLTIQHNEKFRYFKSAMILVKLRFISE